MARPRRTSESPGAGGLTRLDPPAVGEIRPASLPEHPIEVPPRGLGSAALCARLPGARPRGGLRQLEALAIHDRCEVAVALLAELAVELRKDRLLFLAHVRFERRAQRAQRWQPLRVVASKLAQLKQEMLHVGVLRRELLGGRGGAGRARGRVDGVLFLERMLAERVPELGEQ